MEVYLILYVITAYSIPQNLNILQLKWIPHLYQKMEGYSPTDNSKENWSGSPQAPEVGPTHLCESNPRLLPTLSLDSFAIVSEKKTEDSWQYRPTPYVMNSKH